MKSNIIIARFKDDKPNTYIDDMVWLADGQYGYYKPKKDKETGKIVYETIVCGAEIRVVEVSTDIFTAEVFLILEITDTGGNVKLVEISREKLNSKDIIILAKYGAQVDERSAPYLVKLLSSMEAEAKHTFRFKKRGFYTLGEDERTVFCGYKLIDPENKIKAKYYGNRDIEPKGSFKKWKKLMVSTVLPSVPLTTMLCVGGSGLFIDYLKDKVQCSNLILAICGNSSSGKTSVCEMAVSVLASPQTQVKMNSTQNAILKNAESSFCTLLDEVGLTSNKNLTNFIFSLAEGREKERYNDETELHRFSSTYLITAETSIVNKMVDNVTGIRLRMCEMCHVDWMESAEECNYIKKTVRENYGWMQEKLARRILEDGEKTVLEKYYKCLDTLINHAKSKGKFNQFTTRECQQLAFILLSGCYMEEIIGYCFDFDGIIDFLFKHSLAASDDICIGIRAVKHIAKYLEANSRYVARSRENMFIQKLWCYIETGAKYPLKNGKYSSRSLVIKQKCFEDILAEGLFYDPSIVLKSMNDEGILNRGKEHLFKIKKYNNESQKVYIIRLPDEEDVTDDEIIDDDTEELIDFE